MIRTLLVIIAAVVAIVATTGCTPDEIEAWLEWHAADPVAAQAHLERPEVQAAIATAAADRVDPPRSIWDDLAACESGERWDYNGSSGYDGGLQFHPSTWRAMDPPTAYAWQASRAQQIAVAERLLDVQGWGAWPGCARKLGLR